MPASAHLQPHTAAVFVDCVGSGLMLSTNIFMVVALLKLAHARAGCDGDDDCRGTIFGGFRPSAWITMIQMLGQLGAALAMPLMGATTDYTTWTRKAGSRTAWAMCAITVLQGLLLPRLLVVSLLQAASLAIERPCAFPEALIRAGPNLSSPAVGSAAKGDALVVDAPNGAGSWAVCAETGALVVRVSKPAAGYVVAAALPYVDAAAAAAEAAELEDADLDFHEKRDRREAREHAASAAKQKAATILSRLRTRAWNLEKKRPSGLGPRDAPEFDFDEWSKFMPKGDVAFVRAPSTPPRSLASKDPEAIAVSVVVASTAAQRRAHDFLYDCFNAQTYDRLELVVFDEGGAPSPTFAALDDPRVTYVHAAAAGLDAGAKRTALQRLARGDVLAVFEPGCLYAPTYVAAALPHLLSSGLAAVQLRRAFAIDGDGAITAARCSPSSPAGLLYWKPAHESAADAWADGHADGFLETKVVHGVNDDFGVFARGPRTAAPADDGAPRGAELAVDDVPNAAMRALVRKYRSGVLGKGLYQQ